MRKGLTFVAAYLRFDDAAQKEMCVCVCVLCVEGIVLWFKNAPATTMGERQTKFLAGVQGAALSIMAPKWAGGGWNALAERGCLQRRF